MIKVHTDFNARTPDGGCWILWYGGVELERQLEKLGLAKGSKITLYQDENDFEVTGTLDFRYIDNLQGEAWIAIPDWSTLIRKEP